MNPFIARLVLVLSLCFAPLSVRADACSDTSDGGQKATYCEAAKDAKKSQTAATAGMAVWGAVAGVCGYACAMSYAGGAMESVCTWSNIGGTVADLTMTLALAKDMQSSMGSMVGLLGSGATAAYSLKSGSAALNGAKQSMVNLSAGEIGSTKEISNQSARAFMEGSSQAPAKETSWGSCLSAGMAALQVVMKGVTLSQAKKTQSENLAQASTLENRQPAALGLDAGSSDSMTPAAASRAVVGSGDVGVPAGTADSAAIISAATAGNPGLENLIKDPRFASEFKKASGMNLGDYLASGGNKSAGDHVAGAMGSLPIAAEMKSKVDGLQAEVAQKMDLDGNARGRAYASGGGSRSPAEHSDGEDLSKMMSQMMEKLIPSQETKLDPEMQKLEFAMKGKDASMIAEDRTMNLFQRVGYRYRKSTDRIERGPWSAPTNRSLAQTQMPTTSVNPRR